MRAALLRNMGDDALEVRDDIELVDVGAGEVKVKIEATGVCHSDLSCMNGTIPQPAPAILGHEGAGIISEVGEGVTDVNVGDHVIVAWSPPCGECAYCGPRNQPNLCSNIQMVMGGTAHFLLDGSPVFGMAGTGTFAEEMIIPHQGVVKIDDDIPLEIGSLIGCGVMTGVGAAINTAKVTP
ncbi:MAG: alcohol dehydrogenase catalytic domain-containing protein, partial [Microthrixaceae bacterium]